MKNIDMSIGKRIKELRKGKLNQAQLAKLVHVSIDTIRRWESNKRAPRSIDIQVLAAILNTSAAYLLGETDNPELCNEEKKQIKMESNVHFEFEEPEILNEKDLVSIPVLSPEQTACCGRGIPAAECTYRNEERVRVDRKDVGALCEGKMPFAIIADGDSMEKWGIKDGSRVVINPVEEVHDFDIALVCYKDRLALKKVQRRTDGGISLLSSDSAVINVLPDEVNIPAVFSIWGKAMSYRYVYEEIGRIKHGL